MVSDFHHSNPNSPIFYHHRALRIKPEVAFTMCAVPYATRKGIVFQAGTLHLEAF